MNKIQKQNAAKYMYDISKGIALLAVVGVLVQGEWRPSAFIFGLIATFATYLTAYILDGGIKNE